MTGTVTSFDDAEGLGVVTADDGSSYRFHCVEIADGSRTIEVGTAVAFRRLRKLGVVEAAEIAS